MMATLTTNAISALTSGVVDLRPMVQVLDIKQIASAQSMQERYKMVLSDGSFMEQALLATRHNEDVKSGRVKKGSVVQLTEYLCNSVQNRKIIIVLSMDVVVVKCEIVGHPKQLIYNTQQQQRASMPMQQAPEFQLAQHLQPGHIKEETGKNRVISGERNFISGIDRVRTDHWFY